MLRLLLRATIILLLVFGASITLTLATAAMFPSTGWLGYVHFTVNGQQWMDEGDIFVRDITHGIDVHLATGISFYSGFTWSPDGRYVASLKLDDRGGVEDYEIVVLDLAQPYPNGRDSVYLTENTAHDFLPTWSPDSKQMAFISPQTVHILDIETGEEHSLDVTGSIREMAWSPNGRWIAFARDDTNGTNLHVIDLWSDNPSKTRMLLGSAESGQLSLTWTPDSQYITLVRYYDGGLALVHVQTKAITTLTPRGDFEVFPAWSPDGSQLAFRADYDDAPAIYVMNAGGSQIRRLIYDQDVIAYPHWLTILPR